MPKLKHLLVSACFETAQSKNNYCMDCAQLILQKAREELNGFLLELDGEN